MNADKYEGTVFKMIFHSSGLNQGNDLYQLDERLTLTFPTLPPPLLNLLWIHVKRLCYPNIWIGSRPTTAKGKKPIVALGRFRGIDPLKELLNVGLLKNIGEKRGRGWVLVDINVGYIEVSRCRLIILHSLFEPEVNLRETEDDW